MANTDRWRERNREKGIQKKNEAKKDHQQLIHSNLNTHTKASRENEEKNTLRKQLINFRGNKKKIII